MSFDDFAASLSSTLATQKMPEWYDIDLHEHKDMVRHQRIAHIHSMKHSQMQDYKARIRIVVGERDELVSPGADQWKLSSYTTPDLEEASMIADETVIRRQGREFVVKSRDGSRQIGFQ